MNIFISNYMNKCTACNVWANGCTTCLLYDGPLPGLFQNKKLVCNFGKVEKILFLSFFFLSLCAFTLPKFCLLFFLSLYFHFEITFLLYMEIKKNGNRFGGYDTKEHINHMYTSNIHLIQSSLFCACLLLSLSQ